MSNSPENLNSSAQDQAPNEWNELSNYDDERKKAKQFTSSELERLAKTVGRVSDDEGVIALNLALRYKEYERQLNAYNQARKTNTMVQQGPMEDLATAKRELEEAMYLYDSTFANLDEKQHRRDLTDRERARQVFSNGPVAESGNAILRIQNRLNKRDDTIKTQRENAAEKLQQNLPNIVNNIEQSEVFKTYDLYKENEPSIRDRRIGFDGAGENGLYGDNRKVNLALYPHAPEKTTTPNNPDPNNPENGTNPDSSDPNNPDNPNPENSNPDNPNSPDNPNQKGESEEDKAAAEEKAKQRKEKLEAIKEMEGKLAKARTELAERYAKNRSIIPGYRDKNDFLEKSNNFEDNLDNLLRAKADLIWDDEQERIGAELQKELDALNPEDGDFEEKKKALIEKYDKEYKKSRDKLKADFTEDFINEQKKLEEETIDRLDNGNLIRKVVHTLRSNKKVKLLLAGAAVAGFAAAVVASGGLAGVGLSYSAAALKAGWVAGAVKGAGMGFLTSRQDSKISAVRGYASMNEEEIRSQLSKILGEAEQGNNTNWLGFNGEGENSQDDTESKTRSVASYILDEYKKANDADYAGNWKRTSKGMLIGGALGALASGLQISKTTMVEKPGDIQVDLSKVDIPEGHGAYDTFTQLGGNPKDLDQALAIMKKIDLQSGGQFVPGSNGETIGLGGAVGDFAHTYPGPINTWPKAAQTYIEAVAKEWAKEGLIDYTRGTIMEPVKQYTAFGLAQFLAGAAGGELAGGVHSTVGNTSSASSPDRLQPRRPESTPEIANTPSSIAAEGIERQIAEREAAAVEREKDEISKTVAEIEKQIAEREPEAIANDIESKIAEREAADIEAQTTAREANSQEFESKLRNELDQRGIDFLGDDDINLILAPTSNTQVNTADIENLADRLTWEDKSALKAFFNLPENRNLMTTQFGEWIIANTPDEDPRITAEREQSWQV